MPKPPPITAQMREYAKEHPSTWLYIVDPGYEAQGENVPQEGIVGAYRIDANGEIDEEFAFNDKYQPSDLDSGQPEPANELERVMQQISTGELPESALPPAVLNADLLLYAPSEEDNQVYAAELSDGSQLVPACTSTAHIPADWPGYRQVPGRLLPELLGDLDLGLNLNSAVQAVIPNRVLLQAASQQ